MTTTAVEPFSLRDAPALIERLLPVQKLSAESYKEQMAVQGKTLTALGNYWKGRKPLILAKACVLGCLLPATDDLAKDLEIFELLMGMDREALRLRLEAKNDKESRALFQRTFAVAADAPYREWVEAACRTEECGDEVFDHIWNAVNAHLGTAATSFPELVEQLGIMRFGLRPQVADTFCGSGQIPFEAARLGCDVYASDLSPVACMLTWGALHIVGGSLDNLQQLNRYQRSIAQQTLEAVDELGVETDGHGWRAKAFLYCAEVRCPQTGWMVPLLPTRVISKGSRAIAQLMPDAERRRYEIIVRTGVEPDEFAAAEIGTVRTDGRGQEPYLTHVVDGVEYRTKISTLRGDYRQADGTIGNRLRLWEKHDYVPRPDDIFQERLYCVQWMRPKKKGRGCDYAFRTVSAADLERERLVAQIVSDRLPVWQKQGCVPDTRIEPGDKTDEPIRTRGWTHWHHLFNPRQLLIAALANQHSDARLKIGLMQMLNANSRLSRWSVGDGDGRSGGVKQVFDNQALNTLFNYGTRGGASKSCQ
jgi:putative DNA methylase